MEGDRDFDEVLRKKISEALDEPIDESVDADDLIFDLGIRYLRMAAAEKKKRADRKRNPLTLWTEGAASAKALIDYVDAVTDKDGPDFIPTADRIAVFDMDGTIFCETDPTWFDFMLYKHRVLEGPRFLCGKRLDPDLHERRLENRLR